MDQLKYFLFDYDGTLCSTHPTINQAIKETFIKYKLDIPDEKARQLAISSGITIQETIALIHPEGKALPVEYLSEMVTSYRSIYAELDKEYTTLFEGAEATLSGLKSQGKTIVVLSNKGFQAVTNSLKFFNLEKYTDLLLAEGSPAMLNQKMKPNSSAYHHVIKKHFHIKSDDQVLMTGDTQSDILFAKKSGIKSCWASYGYGDQQACRRLHPDVTIEKLTSFLSVMQERK